MRSLSVIHRSLVTIPGLKEAKRINEGDAWAVSWDVRIANRKECRAERGTERGCEEIGGEEVEGRLREGEEGRTDSLAFRAYDPPSPPAPPDGPIDEGFAAPSPALAANVCA